MIFYFSATGNSKYVANQLAEDGEQIIFIPDVVDHGIYTFMIESDEKVGIISPTYSWTLPSIVEDFLKKLKLQYTNRPYLYYVGTFGTTTGAAAAKANYIMKAKGLKFDAMFDVKMPDTWTPFFDLSNKQRIEEINMQAEIQINRVKNDIRRKVKGKHMHVTTPYFTGVIGKSIYDHQMRRTDHFTVEDGCIGCGLCAKKCPEGAIKVENFLAFIDDEKCVNCGVCKGSCPRKCII